MAPNPFLIPKQPAPKSRPARSGPPNRNPLAIPRQASLAPNPGTAGGGRVIPPSHPSVNGTAALVQAYKAGQRPGGVQFTGNQGGGGSIIGNLAHDLVNVATGIPNAAVFIGKDVVAGAAAGTYADIAKVTRIPLPGAGGARSFAASAYGKQKQAASAIAQDYRTRWGPAVSAIGHLATGQNKAAERDIHRLNAQLRQHPGFAALDIGSAAALAGGGVGATLRAVGKLAPETRIGAAALRAGSKSISPGGARYLSPIRITRRTGENAREVHVVEINRAPLTSNPLTRPVHRAIRNATPKLRAEIGQYGSRIVGHTVEGVNPARFTGARVTTNPITGPIANYLGPQGQFGRKVFANARDLQFLHADRAAKKTGFINENYAKTIKGLRSSIGRDLQGNRHEEAALFYHLQDAFRVAGKTPAEARASIVRTQLEHIAANPTAKNANSLRQVETLRGIPEHMLDLSTAPKRLQRAVVEGKRISRTATDIRVASGQITPETAARMASAPGEVLHAGSRFDPRLVNPTPEVLAARAEVASARSAMRGTAAQMMQVRSLAPSTVTAPSGLVTIRSGPMVGAGVRIGRGTERLGAITAPAAREATTGMVERAHGAVMGAANLTSPTATDLRAATTRLAGARTTLRRVENQNRGGLTTPDPYTAVGGQGVYVPHVAVDRLKALNGPGGRVGGRVTQEPIHRRTYSLLLSGNVTTDARLPMYAVSKAVAAEMHSEFIKDFVQKFGARVGGPKGELATGPAALERLKVDPQNTVLISASSLQHGLLASDDLEFGRFPSQGDLAGVFYGPGQEETVARLIAAGHEDVIAVPREAAEVLRGSITSPGKYVQKMDSVLNAWRSGILAFSPRWYMNNLFGNTLQYGLLAGPDVKSIIQANRPEFRNAIDERVSQATVARDARAMSTRLGVDQSVVRHASEVGYEFNQHMEAFLRRGAYLASAKKVLRGEGVKVNRLTDSQLAHAVEFAPEHLKAEMIRRTELFLGDYRRMSNFERNVLRRFFPFYSWIRVISKLTASLPLRHPLRAEALAVTTQMGTAVENPLDAIIPWYDRGGVNIGPFRVRTSSINPVGTVAGFVVGAGNGDPLGALNELATGSANPAIGMAAQALAGRNLFTGRDVTAPPGFNGTAQQFGRQPSYFNQAEGIPESGPITVPWTTAISEAIPQMSMFRGLLSAGRTPYDVVSTPDLALNALGLGKPAYQLYMPPPKHLRGSQKIPVVSALSGFLGAPVTRFDEQAALQNYLRSVRDLNKAQRNTRRQVRRVASRVGP